MIVDLMGRILSMIQENNLHEHKSFACFSLLAEAARIVSDPSHERMPSSQHTWLDAARCKALAVSLDRLVDCERSVPGPLNFEFGSNTLHWLVELDSDFEQFEEWWQLCDSLKPKVGTALPETARVIQRVLAGRTNSNP